jgi:aerobic carbon-monoxide dehydrogenase large subunit
MTGKATHETPPHELRDVSGQPVDGRGTGLEGPGVAGLIGKSIPNRDGQAIVTGRAKYTVDLQPANLAIGKIFRSPVAHALIKSVNADRARTMEGVLDVIVSADVADLPYVSTGPRLDMPLLAQDKVRYVGEPLAVVIGETEEAAEAALSSIEFDYEELPVLLDPEDAMRPDAIPLHEGFDGVEGNIAWRQNTKNGDIEAAFANAFLVVSERFQTSKQQAMPMEPHAAVADWDPDTGFITMWSSTQQSHVVRDTLARVFGLPASKIRVIKPYVGGAFGHKTGLNTNEAMAVLASKRLRRPVKIALSRREEFACTVSRNPQDRLVEVALSEEGKILGWREKIIQDGGAYAGISVSVLGLSSWVTAGPYDIGAIDLEAVLVYTNKPPSGAFRGFGNPQSTFARELMIDICARKLGIDRVEIRRRNTIKTKDLPKRNINGLLLKTLPIDEAITKVLEAIGWDELNKSKPANTGVGLALMIEWGGGCRWLEQWDADMSSTSVTMHTDGSVVVASDAADSGQGHATVFSQIVSDVLGVSPDKVDVMLADTATSPYGLGTFASRTMVVQGTALYKAATEIRDKLFAIASQDLEVDAADLEVDAIQHRVRVKGTDTGKSIAELAIRAHLHKASLPSGTEVSALVATATHDTPSEVPDANGFGNFAGNYTCSATVAVVEIDPDTGKVTVKDWASVEDQVQGGIAQGIGYALGEDLIIDSNGAVLNASMADYQVPTAPQVPVLDKLFNIESLDPTYPLQNKGIGESGVSSPGAAIASAIFDAIGVPVTSLPMNPEKVLAAMARAAKST